MQGIISTLPYFHCEFKTGVGKPIDIQALDFEDAKKRALAYYKKNSGYPETVDLYSTIENTIESVLPLDEY